MFWAAAAMAQTPIPANISGSPSAGQISMWVDSLHIGGYTVSGDGTISQSAVLDIHDYSHSYTSGTQQFFPSNLPNPSLVIGFTNGDIITTGPIGGVWFNQSGLGGNSHMDWWDGNFSHDNLNDQDTPCVMANGCSGTSGPTVLANGGQLNNESLGNATYNSFVGSPPNFDSIYYYYNPSNVPPGFSSSTGYSPAVNFAQFFFQTTNNGMFFLGESNQPGMAVSRTVVSGTVAMPTTAISNGSCATGTNTFSLGSASNVLSTDVLSWSYQGTPTAAKSVLQPLPSVSAGAVSITYCNNTGSSVTMPAVTLNFGVTR